jgi:hypothetical protein
VARETKPPKRRRPSAVRNATKRKAAPKRASARKASDAGARTVDVEPGRIEEMLHKLRTEVGALANKGRYTRVRFKFRGKQLLPDLPLAAVIAAEGLTFYWTGILRALLVNVAGRSVLSVELVNDSGRFVRPLSRPARRGGPRGYRASSENGRGGDGGRARGLTPPSHSAASLPRGNRRARRA